MSKTPLLKKTGKKSNMRVYAADDEEANVHQSVTIEHNSSLVDAQKLRASPELLGDESGSALRQLALDGMSNNSMNLRQPQNLKMKSEGAAIHGGV